jgi:hypothetical protein
MKNVFLKGYSKPAGTIWKSILGLSILFSNNCLPGRFEKSFSNSNLRDAVSDDPQTRAERMPVAAFAIFQTRV